ncbi:nad dependent epimerase dehydratase family [Fusarium pseudocircinatum]|uniref:Nad dependent epimerase dehydratase family n=1 Tax=Fusarium pseudocircinatum TaxID=56676 RepID=A0A8H5KE71_9HYPO|nr:nad dependent epimerase dehydratase family [Fusarium pseudocircinatum]
MAPQVFILGATGLIGGDLLYSIIQQGLKWNISCLVRNENRGAVVSKTYPNVRLVYGDLDSLDTIEREAAASDLVYSAANIDHLESARAIIRGLKSRKSPSWYIHTSGAGILGWETRDLKSFGRSLPRSYNDWDGLKQLTSIPDHAPHRDVEKTVLEAHNGSPNLYTAIVCPPLIYGVGRGPGNQHSVQANLVASSIMKYGQGFTLNGGQNVWNTVHVHDLSKLFVLLGEAAINGGDPATWNDEGYYLAENDSVRLSDLVRATVNLEYKRGLIKTNEVVDLSHQQVDEICPDYDVYCGTDSVGTAIRAKKILGWKPDSPSLLDTLPDVISHEAKKLSLES